MLKKRSLNNLEPPSYVEYGPLKTHSGINTRTWRDARAVARLEATPGTARPATGSVPKVPFPPFSCFTAICLKKDNLLMPVNVLCANRNIRLGITLFLFLSGSKLNKDHESVDARVNPGP